VVVSLVLVCLMVCVSCIVKLKGFDLCVYGLRATSSQKNKHNVFVLMDIPEKIHTLFWS